MHERIIEELCLPLQSPTAQLAASIRDAASLMALQTCSDVSEPSGFNPATCDAFEELDTILQKAHQDCVLEPDVQDAWSLLCTADSLLQPQMLLCDGCDLLCSHWQPTSLAHGINHPCSGDASKVIVGAVELWHRKTSRSF
jgi:hypothetical protein